MNLLKRSKLLHGAVVLALASIALPAAANGPDLIVNGSFEQTTLPYTGMITATDVTGWSSTSEYNELYYPGTADRALGAPSWWQWLWGPNDGSPNGLPATSPSGGNFVAIDADPTITEAVGSLNQTVKGLTVGATYELSFYYGAAQFTTRLGPTTNYWDVSLGDQSQVTPTLDIASEGFAGWFHDTMAFTATSTTEVLSFWARGTPVGYPPASLLDGVSLVQVDGAPPVTAVPEPGNAALLALGLTCFGFVARRRGRKA